MRKKCFTKLLSLIAASALALSLAACGSDNADSSTTQNEASAVPEESYETEVTEVTQASAASDLLAELQGEYTDLFPTMGDESAKEIWYEAFNTYLGVEDTDTAEMLRQAIIGMYESTVYGDDALALTADDANYGCFDCYLENMGSFTIDGDVITIYDEDGEEIASHTYTYYDTVEIDYGVMNDVYGAYFTEETWPSMTVFESDGEDDGFHYFAFCADTPAETYHLEFRYGDNLEDISHYFDGCYAYWLASAIYTDCPDEMLTNVINLFVSENADSFAALAS